MFRQDAPQPRNTELPVALAVKVTGVLGEKLAAQVGGQLIPIWAAGHCSGSRSNQRDRNRRWTKLSGDGLHLSYRNNARASPGASAAPSRES